MYFPLQSRGIGARIRNTGNFTCPNNALTAATFNIIDFDTLGTIDLINLNTKIVILKEGWYFCVAGTLGWASNATNERASWLTQNGTNNFGRQVKGSADASPIAYMTVTGFIYCMPNDYIQHLLYQNISGGGTLVVAQATLSVLQLG